ncbi:uncharacterized protein LOC133778857 [Humulus lupulus]|uniref:uncharacterized protein LOC133778857 n=1 Tax=Humulus lupulus TaxID=3486 RepID=UPI002B4118D0|nr:uncharacterized protein LOC133778857 [Humulus lupulus]
MGLYANQTPKLRNSIDEDLNLLTTTSSSPSPTQPNDAVSTQVHGDLPFISTTSSSPDFPTDSNVRSEFQCKKSVMRPVFEQPIRVTSFKDLISPKFLTTKRAFPLSELEDDHNSTLQINTNLISSQGNNGTPASGSTTTDNNELVLVEVKRFKPKSIQEICCTCRASKCLKLYCSCFKAGKYCTKNNCGCRNCKNTADYKNDVDMARSLHRNHTFQPKTFSIVGSVVWWL